MKTNKKITTSLTIAAGITVSGVTGASDTAYADEVQKIEQPSVKSETVTPQKEVTKQNVNDAKDKVDNAQTTANEKDTIVSEKESELESAKDNTAQTEKDLNDAQTAHDTTTEKDVAQAEKNVKEAEQAVAGAITNHDNAQNDATTAGQEESQAKTDYDNAKTESEKANDQVIEKETEVKKAESDVKEAEETVTKNETAVNEVEKDVAQKETNVENAKQDLEEASKSESESAKKTEDAKNTLDAAQKEKADKEKDEKEVQDKVTKQESVVKDAENATKYAEDKLANQGQTRYPETINLSQEWLDAFQKLSEAKSENDKAEYRAQLDKISDKEASRLFAEFEKNSTLSTELSYDMNNLSVEMQKELNLYLITLINSIHNALGDDKRVQANENLITFANDVADEYQKSPTYGNSQHNVTAINNAAKKNELKTHTINLYENANFSFSTTEKVSEYALYNYVYESVVAMFAGDKNSKYAHGLSLIKSDTLGMSLESRLDTDDIFGFPFTGYLTTVHIVNVAQPNLLIGPETYEEAVAKYENLYGKNSDANLATPTNDTAKLQQAVKDAQENEAKEKDTLDQLTKQHEDAKDQLSLSILAVAKAQEKYDKLVQAPTSVNVAQKALDEAEKELAQAKTTLETAIQSLSDSKDLLKGNQVRLASVQEELAQAKEQQAKMNDTLQNAKQTLDSKSAAAAIAKNKLATTEKELQDAHDKLVVAQKVLKTLQDTGVALEEAQKAYDEALAKQKDAEKAYTVAVEEARQAHDALTKAKNEYNNIYSQYLVQQTIDGNKPTPTVQDKPTTSVAQGTVSLNVIPVKSNTSNNAVNIKQVANTAPNRFTSEVGKTLPQTGAESDSMLAKIGLGMLGVLMALVPFKLKNR